MMLKKSKIVMLAMLSFMVITPNIASARVSGVDLYIQNIKFDHNVEAGQLVDFAIYVKNRGRESTEVMGLTIDFGNGMGMGFGGTIVIKPGETRVFNLGIVYQETGKFVIKASVNTSGDVNLGNNAKTAIIVVK